MKFLSLLVITMSLLLGSTFACPQDDPPSPGGEEGTAKPAPAKPVK